MTKTFSKAHARAALWFAGAAMAGLAALPAAAVEIGETVEIKIDGARLMAEESKDRGAEAVQSVTKVVMALIEGIEENNVEQMSRVYGENEGAMFYGASVARKIRGTKDFVLAQNQCRETLLTVDIQPRDMQVQYLGDVAIATLTGTNEMVTRDNMKDGSTWRWSLVMHDAGGGDWRVTHEHYSFEPM
ncbi:YybH family protein [Tropicibacter sp. S64]|uniref:YybH family protein n=1 Tax=Tropicibacter sp. S64 TaxID=3415122 RepID=UPI003C7A4485